MLSERCPGTLRGCILAAAPQRSPWLIPPRTGTGRSRGDRLRAWHVAATPNQTGFEVKGPQRSRWNRKNVTGARQAELLLLRRV